MTAMIATLDLEEFRTLTRMAMRSEPFVATIARATLAIVEARRDAETRAALSELALEAAQERFAAIREVITSAFENGPDQTEALRQIASLAA